MSKLISFTKAIAAAGVLATVAVSAPSFAAPGGNGVKAGLGKQLWKFNVISIPSQSGWDGGDHCNGAKIFFEDSSGQLTWKFDPFANKDFEIADCDGTDGAASVIVDESLEVDIAVRLLGPNDSNLDIVCSEVQDDGNDHNFCVIDHLQVNKQGRTNFNKVLSTVSDGAYEEYLWELSGDWKIFDVRVFESTD